MYVYLWALFFILIGNNSKKIIQKIIFYTISSFLFFYILSNFSVIIREIVIYEDILDYFYREQFLLSILSTPFILLSIVLFSLIRVGLRLTKSIKIYVFLILVVIALTTYLIKILPDLFPIESVIFSQLIVDERKKNNNSLELFSNKMIRDLNVMVNNQVYSINKIYESKINVRNSVDRPFSWKIVKNEDKNYNVYNLHITSNTFIDDIKLYLVMPIGYHPLSSNLEFEKLEDNIIEYNQLEEIVYKFFTPRFIEKEFFFEIIIPNNIKDSRLDFSLLYQYNVSKDIVFNYNNFIYKKSLFLEREKLN